MNNEIDRPLIPNNEGIKNRHYLSLYTIGGFRYFVSIQLPILQVFPLEDGLIVKCKYDPKLLRVSFKEMRRDPSYAYITLTDHPLEDLRPLAIKYSEKDVEPTFGARKTLHNMIDTKYDLLFVSDTIPIAVLFDEIKSEVVFATLRRNKNDNPDVDFSEDVSFESFFKKERHNVISHISNTSQLVLNQVMTDFIDSGVKPDQFEIVDR